MTTWCTVHNSEVALHSKHAGYCQRVYYHSSAEGECEFLLDINVDVLIAERDEARESAAGWESLHRDEHARVVRAWAERDKLRKDLIDLQDRFDHLESEWVYGRDRGDHAVYRDEWEAFDRWQREHRPVTPYSQRDKQTG